MIFQGRSLVLFLSLSVLASTGHADAGSDEDRLLQSWGLQMNAGGQLVFKHKTTPTAHFTPWRPQQLASNPAPARAYQRPHISPLVVSAKKKAQQ